jgi:hypothetical protein
MTDRRRGVTIAAFDRAKYIFREHCQNTLQNEKRYDSDSAGDRAFL